MNKDRDWVDYTQLGLDAAQLARLSGIAATLERMEQTVETAQRHERELDRKRQMVVVSDQLLTKLESDDSVSVQRKYLYIFEIERELQRGRVTPAQSEWSRWEDIHKVLTLERKIEAARKSFGDALPTEERAEADSSWRFMLEDFDLCWLIRRRSSEETLASDRERLTQPHEKRAAENSDTDLDRDDERKLIQQFGEASSVRLRELRKSRRERIRRVLGAAVVEKLEAEERTETEEDHQQVSEIPLPSLWGAILALVILAALGCGLFYGGLNVCGIIGEPNGKEDGDFFFGFLLMIFGVCAFGGGVALLYKSAAQAIRDGNPLSATTRKRKSELAGPAGKP